MNSFVSGSNRCPSDCKSEQNNERFYQLRYAVQRDSGLRFNVLCSICNSSFIQRHTTDINVLYKKI